MQWRIAGAYLESCNCETICPCRMVDGVLGGRSTYGVCFGLLSWRIDEGHANGTDLSGMAVALALRYDDDDEAGSPWTMVLYVDERGTKDQQKLVSEIFLGELGGPHVVKLPWVRKPRHLVDIRPARVELAANGKEMHIGGVAAIRVSRPANDGHTVACGIPGYERVGNEYYADELRVQDDPFDWQLEGNCAYATTFEYKSG